ncbi:TonB-dependent receptor plug domain-containing protein [Sphingomonas sp. M1A8_2b]
MNFSVNRSGGLFAAPSALAVLIAMTAAPAMAQTAAPGDTANLPATPAPDTAAPDAPQSPAATVPDSEIVVTGTRIRRPDYDSPSPIVSLGAQTIQQSGTTNLTDFLTGYPALIGSSTSGDNSGDRAGIGATGLNQLNLRNLGTNRSLTLVNGRRHVAGLAGDQSVDVNTIPNDLVERIEVLTGGTSAIYGADAVTGVVNFILKTDFEGLTARGQAGISAKGDTGQRLLTVTAGKNFADGRGNIALAYEYGMDDRLQTRDRSYLRGANRVGFYRNPNYVANTPGSYLFVPQTDIRYDGTSRRGGVDVNGDGYPEFDGDGSVWDPGITIPGGYAKGGSATSVADYGNDLRPEVERHVVNAIAHFDVSDKFKIFAEGKYANIRSFSLAQPSFDYYLFVPSDNPYIPASIRSAIDPEIGGVLVTRDNFDLGQRGENIRRETYRGVGGVRGDLSDSLSYELSYNYGRTNVTSRYVNDIYDDRFFAAIDAVRDPATGQITCRANIQPGWTPDQPFASGRDVTAPTTFAPGQCSPINLFGEGQSSQAGLDFIKVNTTDRSFVEQQVVNGFVSGDFRNMFSLPGGELGFVVGGEYRKERSGFTPDPLAAQGLTYTNALSPTIGQYSVKEGFAELNAPLLRNVRFAHQLEFGAAIRYSDYSTTGSTTTWQLNGQYAPVRDLRLRATYSSATRAPNINELFGGGSQTFEFFNDPCKPENLNLGEATRAANCKTILAAAGLNPAQVAAFDDTRSVNISGFQSGNPSLTPETAKTWTAGAVLEPRFLPGLSVSFDWYDIRLKNAINQVTAQQLSELCVDQADTNNVFCQSITRQTGTGLINGFTVRPQNVASFRTAGLDLNLNYRLSAGDLGVFNFKVIGNYLNKLEFVGTPGAPVTDSLQTTFAPKFQTTGDLTWVKGPLTLNYGVQWFDKTRRFSKNSLDGNPNYSAPEYVFYKDRWVHDIYASVDVAPNFSMYGGVNNVANEKPAYGSTTYPVDAIGRFFFVGARIKMPKF